MSSWFFSKTDYQSLDDISLDSAESRPFDLKPNLVEEIFKFSSSEFHQMSDFIIKFHQRFDQNWFLNRNCQLKISF